MTRGSPPGPIAHRRTTALLAALALTLSGCGWYFQGLAQQPHMPDYRVVLEREIAPGGPLNHMGETERLASQHLIAVTGIAPVTAPPDGMRWHEPPIGTVLAVTLEITDDGAVTNQALALPSVLVPVRDGRRFASGACLGDAQEIIRDVRAEGHATLKVCIDLPPGLLGEVTEVEVVDATHPDAHDRHAVLPAPRWRVELPDA